MNGNEKAIAVSMSGLMSIGITEERAFDLIENADPCIGADWELVKDYLDDLQNGVVQVDELLEKPSNLPEDLFHV